MTDKPLFSPKDTVVNHVPIGSIELKLVVARAEGYEITEEKTRYHHVVDGELVTSVDESKPTYYYYGPQRLLLPLFNPYHVAMEFYLRKKKEEEESNANSARNSVHA